MKRKFSKYLSNNRGAALLILMTSFVVASMVIATSMINSQQIAESYEAVRVQRQVDMFHTATYGGDFRVSGEAGSDLTFVNHHLSNPSSFSQVVTGGFTGGIALNNGTYNSTTNVFSGLGMVYDGENNLIVGPEQYIQQLESYLEENQIDINDLNMSTLPNNITTNLNILNNSGLMNAPKVRIEMRDGTPMTAHFFNSTTTKLTKIDGTVVAGNVSSLEAIGQPGVYTLPTVPSGYYRLRLTESIDIDSGLGTGWMAAAYGTTTLEIPIWIYKNMASGDVAKTIVLDTIDWWNPNWAHRIKLTFQNTGTSIPDIAYQFAIPVDFMASGWTTLVNTDPEILYDFPTLVKIDADRVTWANINANGSDIRFIDADNETELDYEIEYCRAGFEGHFWVKVPQIDIGDEDYIWMYYGNSDADTTTESPNDVWTDRFYGVYHLGEEKMRNASNTYYLDYISRLVSSAKMTDMTTNWGFNPNYHILHPDSTAFENHGISIDESFVDVQVVNGNTLTAPTGLAGYDSTFSNSKKSAIAVPDLIYNPGLNPTNVQVIANPTLGFMQDDVSYTIETWAKSDEIVEKYGVILGAYNGDLPNRYVLLAESIEEEFFAFGPDYGAYGGNSSIVSPKFTDAIYHHVALVQKEVGGVYKVQMIIDGLFASPLVDPTTVAKYGMFSIGGLAYANYGPFVNAIFNGWDFDYYSALNYDGSIEEVRVAGNSRSEAWLHASFKSSADYFLNYGAEEDYPGS